MSTDIDSLMAQALTLSPEDRALLADRLVASLADAELSELEECWLSLARMRKDEVLARTAELVSGAEALESIRQQIGADEL